MEDNLSCQYLNVSWNLELIFSGYLIFNTFLIKDVSATTNGNFGSSIDESKLISFSLLKYFAALIIKSFIIIFPR